MWTFAAQWQNTVKILNFQTAIARWFEGVFYIWKYQNKDQLFLITMSYRLFDLLNQKLKYPRGFCRPLLGCVHWPRKWSIQCVIYITKTLLKHQTKIVKFDSQIKQIWKRTFENTKFSERKIVINIHNFFSYRSNLVPRVFRSLLERCRKTLAAAGHVAPRFWVLN